MTSPGRMHAPPLAGILASEPSSRRGARYMADARSRRPCVCVCVCVWMSVCVWRSVGDHADSPEFALRLGQLVFHSFLQIVDLFPSSAHPIPSCRMRTKPLRDWRRLSSLLPSWIFPVCLLRPFNLQMCHRMD